jgi:hypothetical protein
MSHIGSPNPMFDFVGVLAATMGGMVLLLAIMTLVEKCSQ